MCELRGGCRIFLSEGQDEFCLETSGETLRATRSESRSGLHIKGCKGGGVLRRELYSVKVDRQDGGGGGLSIKEKGCPDSTTGKLGEKDGKW